MQYKISLVVDGVDLGDDATLVRLAHALNDLVWTQEGGQTLATIYVDEHPVLNAHDYARRIRHTFPNSCVHRVDRGLVGVSDVAERAGVTPEAVRMWTTGKRGPGHFPKPAGAIGGGRKGPAKIWFWADVNVWLDNHYRLGDGYRYLSDRQAAQLEERLTQSTSDFSIPARGSYYEHTVVGTHHISSTLSTTWSTLSTRLYRGDHQVEEPGTRVH